MRILCITPSFQHPRVRGSLRHYYFVRELSQRHAITLLSLTKVEIPAEAMQEMASYTERIITVDTNSAGHGGRGLASRLPYIGKQIEKEMRLASGVQQMKRVFTQLVQQERYDLVLFHGKWLFPVIDGWSGLPLVVDFCDATSMRIRLKMQHAGPVIAPLLLLRYAQVRRVEKKLIRKTPYVAFISERDREAAVGPNEGWTILPNGVDLEYWRRSPGPARPNAIVFHGVMDYGPNEDAALYLIEKIAPIVRETIPDLEVFIVGRNPSPALRERARLHPRVTVTGFVDDVRPYLAQAAVYAAPVRYGSGMQNKALEAMAMELPVVASPMVADGLRVGDESPPLHVAQDETLFARHLVHLLNAPEERARLASDGRRYVERYFVWSQIAKQLERLCLEAAGAKYEARNQGQPALYPNPATSREPQ